MKCLPVRTSTRRHPKDHMSQASLGITGRRLESSRSPDDAAHIDVGRGHRLRLKIDQHRLNCKLFYL